MPGGVWSGPAGLCPAVDVRRALPGGVLGRSPPGHGWPGGRRPTPGVAPLVAGWLCVSIRRGSERPPGTETTWAGRGGRHGNCLARPPARRALGGGALPRPGGDLDFLNKAPAARPRKSGAPGRAASRGRRRSCLLVGRGRQSAARRAGGARARPVCTSKGDRSSRADLLCRPTCRGSFRAGVRTRGGWSP